MARSAPWTKNGEREAHELIRSTITEYATCMGATADVYIKEGYPVLYNEPALTADTRKWTEEFLGKEQVVDIPKWMAGEDFARYSHLLGSCFYRLGVQYPGEEKSYSPCILLPSILMKKRWSPAQG